MFTQISQRTIGVVALSLAGFILVSTVVTANRGDLPTKKGESKRQSTANARDHEAALAASVETAAANPSEAATARVNFVIPAKSAVSSRVNVSGDHLFKMSSPRSLSVPFDTATQSSVSSTSRVGRTLALTTGDFNLDGAPDLVAGFAADSGGVVTYTEGNIDAYAPRDQAIFRQIQKGIAPPSLSSESRTIGVPTAPDFLLSGDFNKDGMPDIVTAARGTGTVYLLTGDGAGNFKAPTSVKVSGAITAVAAGTFGQNGGNTVVVAIDGPAGPQALVFAARTGGLLASPTSFTLPAAAESITFGDMDKDGGSDFALAAGREVVIIHGLSEPSKMDLDDPGRVEQIELPFEARSISLGYFVENRAQRKTIAVLAADGSIYLLQPRDIDTRPYSPAELATESTGDQEVARVMENWDARPLPPEWSSETAVGWQVGTKLGATAPFGNKATTQGALISSFATYQRTSDLFVLNSKNNRVELVQHPGHGVNAPEKSMAFDMSSSPTALVEMPRQVDGRHDLIMLQADSPAPLAITPLAATSVTVDRFDDVAAASACTVAANDCSLRGAVTFANAGVNSPTTINIPAGTYTITLSGGDDANATGDLDLLGISSTPAAPSAPGSSGVAFVGAGAPTTIIQVAAGLNERMFQVSPGATNPTVGWVGSWSGLTMQNGGSTGVLSGGAILMGGTDNIYTIASCIFNNNTLGGSVASNGGAISQSAKNNGGCGQLTITNTNFTNNTTATGVGGGLRNLGGTTTPGTEFTNITGGTFDNNKATTNAGGGVFHTIQAGTSNYNKIQFTNNKAYFTGAPSTNNGGGGIQKSNGTINANFCRFRNNSAGTVAMPGSGEGVQLGGNGDLNAVNDWWGCNLDPTSAGADAAGCDTAFKVVAVTGTLTVLPRLVLKNTANPNPIVTGQDTTLTASINTNSANQDVSASVIALLDLPVTWSNPVRGNLSNQQLVLSNVTRNITTATESGTTVTITTTVAHTFTTGQTVLISGVSDSRYTGVYTIASTPTTTTFTYAHPISGLPAASGGTAKISTGTATATFRASAAGAGSADATVESAVATANFTINKADTTTTITNDTPDPTVSGQSFTVSFSLSVNAPGSNSPTVPTGNVLVTADTGETCTGAINAATPATGSCSLTIFHAGSRTITAAYQGDANFNVSPASSPTTAHLVNKADTTTAITSDNPDPSVTGQSVTVQYSVSVVAPGSAQAGNPTGNVVVTDNGNTFCTGTVAGTGSCSAVLTSAGAHTFVATYQGDANYNASLASPSAAHTVNKADTTASITSDNPDPSVTGQSVTVVYTVTVNAPGSANATFNTGNVVVTDNGNPFCNATIATGQCSAALTTPGAHTFVATYQGDTNYNASPGSTGASHTVNKANTTAAVLTDTPDPSVTGQSVTFTYSVSVTAPGSGTPTGNVDIKDGATIICTGTVAAGTCSGPMNVAGARNVTATYNGDTNFNASAASPTAAHQVNKADTTTTITSDNPDPSSPGQSVTVQWTTMVNAPGSGTPTGTVTVTVSGGAETCNAPVATGQCSLVLNATGTRTITASYAGDSNFNGSSDTESHDVFTTTVSVNDAKVAEPPSGTTNMLFAVVLSGPAPVGGASVQYATADQAPGAGHAVGGGSCGAGVDYVTASLATLNFAVGEQVKIVPITICSDADNSEPDETFLLNLSNPVNTSVSDGQAVGTIAAANPAGTFIISELRTRGSAGAGDDFVELYNNTNSQLTVAASDASAGYGVYKMGTDCNAIPVLIGTIPNGIVIPARGHYLMFGSAYSLANYGGAGAAAGNLAMSSDIEDDHNVAVFSTANVLNISSANRLDAVGYSTNSGGICDLMREGSSLVPVGALNIEYSYFRTETSSSGGNPKDTNDNSADFLFADTAMTNITGITTRLGAPGPENLASPIRRDNSGILVALLDGTLTSSQSPNRFRDFAPVLPNGVTGTLQVRRRVQNNTGGPVTQLRFRIVDMTTGPTPAVGTADLRAITSSPATVSVNDAATCLAANGPPGTTPCMVTAQTTTLETPPGQAAGGGYNSTLMVTLGTPLANAASVEVNFTLGVQQGGTFRFLIIVEALP